ncbi:hypothetical protein, partial [Klebsiella pneumoniae]
HIRYYYVFNAKYHIQYDFMCVVLLSYPLRVSLRADPKRCFHGKKMAPVTEPLFQTDQPS